MNEIKLRSWDAKYKVMKPLAVSGHIAIFTGLTDIDGVEIYGNDECFVWSEEPYSNSHFDADYDWEIRGIVKMVDFMWAIERTGIEQTEKSFIPLFDIVNRRLKIKVIGNIHSKSLSICEK